jgi:hypothetical protein
VNLPECDQAAADLIREYQRNGQCGVFIRTFDMAGNVRVICPAINAATLATYLNKAADVLFDGKDVRQRNVP